MLLSPYTTANDTWERRYDFVLAFENFNPLGNITEKMIDASRSGSVPFYRDGGEILRETVSSDCYINCSDQDPAAIYAGSLGT